MSLADDVRRQFEDGSVWYGKDLVDPHDGLILAFNQLDTDCPALAAAIFACLSSPDVRQRTGAVALLGEIVPYVGADVVAARVAANEPLFREVAPAWRISSVAIRKPR